MSRKKKIKIFKSILTICVLIIFIGIIIYLFPIMKDLSTLEENVAYTPVSFHPLWSSVYNDASVAYNYGAGYSVKTAKVTDAGDLLFRFPKNDKSYRNSTATFTRDNNGKLAAGQMVVRNTDLNQVVDKDNFTLTLTPSDNGYLIVGNPFVSHLNVEEFLNENSNVLQQKYWIADNDGPEAGSADANGSWISTDFGLVAPYKAFYVQRTENALPGDIEVTFTRDMEEFLPASTDGQDAAQGFVIRANNEKGSSAAALAYSGTADNNYETTEDVQLLTDLLGNESEEPNVYTVAGDIATSINRIKDAQQIPLGVFAADDDVTTLTFTGVAALMPLGAPIGTNRGLETRSQIEIIIEQADLPVVVDAGIGLPSHAAQAMEIGASAVLINTAIAVAENPVEMARAFSLAVRAGRTARLSGAAATLTRASATSPLTGFLDE